MKFGATHSKHRHAHTTSALPAKQRDHQHSRSITTATSWEQRIAKAKKLTASRRTGEQTSTSAEKAGAAYLHWQENRSSRIEELRARIETGTYYVDSMTLAADMIRKASAANDGEKV